jgi:hypothetical protein
MEEVYLKIKKLTDHPIKSKFLILKYILASQIVPSVFGIVVTFVIVV